MNKECLINGLTYLCCEAARLLLLLQVRVDDAHGGGLEGQVALEGVGAGQCPDMAAGCPPTWYIQTMEVAVILVVGVVVVDIIVVFVWVVAVVGGSSYNSN